MRSSNVDHMGSTGLLIRNFIMIFEIREVKLVRMYNFDMACNRRVKIWRV